MNFEQLSNIPDELEQIEKTYEIFNEDIRLNHSQAAKVEFLTTTHFIEKYLNPGDHILDIGAGAGEYSLYFAKKGYQVSALELAESNIRAFQEKITPEYPIVLTKGNAVDLSQYEDDSFDIVLLFGPLYHLHQEEDRQKCIAEARRVCKKKGTMFFSFISHDMVFLTELYYDSNFFSGDSYDHDSLKLVDFPFVFFTADQCRNMLQTGGIHIQHEISSDGASELLADKINAMDEYSYQQYLKYHFYICEKPELLGCSNHLLFVGNKS